MSDNSKKRGFASLSPERVRELASEGGKKAHENGTAHRWTREEAVVAGKKGGASRQKASRAKAAS